MKSFNEKLIISVSYISLLMLGVYLAIYEYTILDISQLYMLNAAMMGAVIAIQYFGMSIAPLLIGKLCFTIGKKKVLQISYGLIILGTLLVGITQSFVAYVVSAFLSGAGFTVTEATLTAVLSDEFPEESKKHLSFSQVAFSLGAFGGPFLAKMLINAGVYFRDLYIYFSAIFLVLAILLMLTKSKNDKGSNDGQGQKFNLLAFLRNKVFLLLVLSVVLYVGTEATIANYADSYFELVRNRPELSAVAISLFWGAMIPSRFLAGIIKFDTKKVIISLALLVSTASIAAMLIPDNTVKIAMFALCGFGCGPIWPLIMSTVAEKNSGATGPSMNVMMAFCGFGGALLPIIAGVFVNFSSQTVAYYICAATIVLMLAVYLSSLKKATK